MTELKIKTKLNEDDDNYDSITVIINHNVPYQIEITDQFSETVAFTTSGFEKLIETYINMKYKSKNKFSDDPNLEINIE